MENKKPKLIQHESLSEGIHEFIEGKPKKKIKEKPSQSNIVWDIEDELDTAKKGHMVCENKMSFNDYQKLAVLEKAKIDIEERARYEAYKAATANIKK